MINGRRTLFIDQHGAKYYARNRADLRRQFGNGGCRVIKLYADGQHVGYIIAGHKLRMQHRAGDQLKLF